MKLVLYLQQHDDRPIADGKVNVHNPPLHPYIFALCNLPKRNGWYSRVG